jgi:hypothetical protein
MNPVLSIYFIYLFVSCVFFEFAPILILVVIHSQCPCLTIPPNNVHTVNRISNFHLHYKILVVAVVVVVVVIAAVAVVDGGVVKRLICRTSLMTNILRPASKECWYWPSSVFHYLVTFFGSSVPRCSKEWFFKIHFVYRLSFNRFLCSLCFYLRRVTPHSCLTVDGR